MTNTRTYAYAIGETRTITSTCYRKNCGLTTSRTFTATWFLNLNSDQIQWVGLCRCGAHLTHTSAAVIKIAEVDSADGITEKQLGMVRSVRNALTADAREDSGLSLGRLASRALNVPITTMAGWVHPNESVLSNVNLVVSMVGNPVMLGASPAKTSDPFAGIEG